MKQRTTISLCALAVLALFVMTATNRSEQSSGLRGLQNTEANSTSNASTAASNSAQSGNSTASAPAATKTNSTSTSTSKPSTNATSTKSSNTSSKNPWIAISIRRARNNKQVFNAFMAGLNDAVDILQNQGKLPFADYGVTQWISASYRNTSQGIYYNFAARLDGPHHYIHILLKPSVFYSYKSKNFKLTGYSYNLQNVTKASFINSTNTTSQSANKTNSSAPASAQNNTNGYTPIKLSDVTNGTRVEKALSYGVEALIQTIIAQNKLPVADPHYRITHLSSAAYKNQTHGIRYDLKADLVNALNYQVDAEMLVDYSSASGNFSLVGYTFKTSGFRSSDLVHANSTSTNSTRTNSTGGK